MSERESAAEANPPTGHFVARAVALGERIDVHASAAEQSRLGHPMLGGPKNATAVIFRYGAVVLFGFDAESARVALSRLTERVSEPHDDPEMEDVEVAVDPDRREGVDGGVVILHEASVGRLQIVAEILGKSIALAQEEQAVGKVFDQIEPLAVDLQRRGRVGLSARGLLRHIGTTLLVQHKTVARVEVAEKPELLWERPDLERLYLRLEDEYELRERHAALERKLRLISDTTETLLELLQTRRSLRVEWYIVLLIVVEIILTLYEMFFRHRV